jgi:hypothetical protein
VPANARAVRADLRVVRASRDGRLAWFAGDGDFRGAPTFSFEAPRGRRNAVRVPLAGSGSGTFALRSTVATHAIVEITGYWE